MPLQGRPLLEYTIRHLVAEGIHDLAINLHYHADSIRRHFGDGLRWGAKIHYAYEPELLGTGGAVKNFDPWLGSSEAFLVMYGDILTNQPLAPLWAAQRRADALAALLVHRRNTSNSIIVMDDDGQITDFIERPDPSVRAAYPDETWVNSGVQVLSRRVLDLLPPGDVCDLPRDVYVPNHKAERLVGVPLLRLSMRH